MELPKYKDVLMTLKGSLRIGFTIEVAKIRVVGLEGLLIW